MKSPRALKYGLFAALFALVLIGLAIKSYTMLIVLVIAAVILGIVGDKLESAPTEKFREYNEKHHRLNH